MRQAADSAWLPAGLRGDVDPGSRPSMIKDGCEGDQETTRECQTQVGSRQSVASSYDPNAGL